MTVSAAHHDSGKLSPGSTVSDEGGHQQHPQFDHMIQEVLKRSEQTLQECEQIMRQPLPSNHILNPPDEASHSDTKTIPSATTTTIDTGAADS